MKKLLFIPAVLAALALVVAGAAKKKEEPGKDAPWVCECGCAKCPPKTVLSKNKGGEYRYRSCFRDANTNSKCDSSTLDGAKCENNCVAVDVEKNKTKKRVPRPPCAGCPCPANCAQCVAAAQ